MNCHSDKLKPAALLLAGLLLFSVPAWSQVDEPRAKAIRRLIIMQRTTQQQGGDDLTNNKAFQECKEYFGIQDTVYIRAEIDSLTYLMNKTEATLNSNNQRLEVLKDSVDEYNRTKDEIGKLESAMKSEYFNNDSNRQTLAELATKQKSLERSVKEFNDLQNKNKELEDYLSSLRGKVSQLAEQCPECASKFK